MSLKVLQINFKYEAADEYREMAPAIAAECAAMPGLRWKVWFINEDQNETGGLYLFEDAASLQAFLATPLVAQITSHPALSDFSVKSFDVMEDVTEITRGPIHATVST